MKAKGCEKTNNLAAVFALSAMLTLGLACNGAGGTSKLKGSLSSNQNTDSQSFIQSINGTWFSDCREYENTDEVLSERAELSIDAEKVEVIYRAFLNQGCVGPIEDLVVRCRADVSNLSLVKATVRSSQITQDPSAPAIVHNDVQGIKAEYSEILVVSSGSRVEAPLEQCAELLPKEGEVFVPRANYILRSKDFDGSVYVMSDDFRYWKQ